MPRSEARDALFEQFARIGKAVASAKRLELLDLLSQGERSVDALANAAAMSITNTSQHLQVLKAARLLESRKEGTKVIYRLADDGVYGFVSALRDLARDRLAEVEQVVRDYIEASDEFEPLGRSELLERVRHGSALVLDVRPHEEYAAGHIPDAISLPLEELESGLGRLPQENEIVAYCRGPYCLLAPKAVELLRENGFRARRLEDGLPEWRLAGLPVVVGAEER